MGITRKIWAVVSDEIGWDDEDPQGPPIISKALETVTINEFLETKFSVRFQEPPEKVARMVALLAENGAMSYAVLLADDDTLFLWVTQGGFRMLMQKWTEVTPDPAPEAVGG